MKTDKIGKQFGNLLITGREERADPRGGCVVWLAKCNLCGKENYRVRTTALKYRTDCGCQKYTKREYPLTSRNCVSCGTSFKHRSNSKKNTCSKKCYNEYKASTARLRRKGSVFNHLRNTVAGARNRANRNNIPCDIDVKWLLDTIDKQGLKCYYTGIDFTTKGAFCGSIDRIDPNKGYVKDNCRLVCWIYNRAKQSDTHEDVLKFCEGALNGEEHRQKK